MDGDFEGGGARREPQDNARPVRIERSLPHDIAYTVAHKLFSKWIVVFVEVLLKVGLFALCAWLMWKGAESLWDSPPAPAAAPAAQSAAAAPTQPAAETDAAVNTALLCILAILVLPVATISFIRTMVSKRSNGVNAFTLGVYTAIDFILAYFVVGPKFDTTAKTLVFLGTGVLSLMYNFMVMNYALRLEDGR